MNKDIIIICESMYNGNTMRLANAMALRLNCEVVGAQDAMFINLARYKIIGLGSGIYFTSHHPKIIEIIGKLSPGHKTFVFSTHGGPFLGNYHKRIKEELFARKIDIMGEFSAKGYDCTGPFIIMKGVNKGRPNEKDQQKSIKFVSGILPQYVKNLSTVPKGQNVHVNEDCISCGKCMDICPMNVFAIKENTVAAVNGQECVHCSMCQRVCTPQAISIQHNAAEAIKIAIKHAKKNSMIHMQSALVL